MDLIRLKSRLYRIKEKLIYRSAFGKAMRRAIWHEVETGDGVKQIHHRKIKVFEEPEKSTMSPSAARDFLLADTVRWQEQEEVVFEIEGDILIEPKLSLGIVSPNRFLTHTRLPAHVHLVPELLSARLGHRLQRRFSEFDALIHFDGYYSRNLYHFLSEAFCSLLMLRRLKIFPADTPVLIHENLLKHAFVQWYLQYPELADVNWVIQRAGQWIKTKKLYKAWAPLSEWKELYRLAGTTLQKNPHRKIFLNRKPVYGRYLTNFSAVEPVLAELGFEVIYAETLSYAEQVKLFSETEFLVALNGAGIMNLIHSDIPSVSVLEIFAENLVGSHYFWLTKVLGGKYYDAMLGSKLDAEWNFTIDPQELHQKITRMLSFAAE